VIVGGAVQELALPRQPEAGGRDLADDGGLLDAM
jgi:hypothetical protein